MKKIETSFYSHNDTALNGVNAVALTSKSQNNDVINRLNIIDLCGK